MNIIKTDKPVSFGIAFKPYLSKTGSRTADLIDSRTELAMYKRLSKKLDNDTFVKTKLGIESSDMKINNEDSKINRAFRVFSKNHEYFFADNRNEQNGVKDAFNTVYDKIKKISEK